MVVVPSSGNACFAPWGVRPQLAFKSYIAAAATAGRAIATSHNCFSRDTKQLASASSSLLSRHTLPLYFNVRVGTYGVSPHHRGCRLIVRADTDYYLVLEVSRNASKSELKSVPEDKGRN